MATLNSLYRMRVPGTRLKLIEAGEGWIANYEVRIKGRERRLNIDAYGDTPQEAVQNANNELKEYLQKYKPQLSV